MAYDPTQTIASILAGFDIRLSAAEGGTVTPTPTPTLNALTVSATTGTVGTALSSTITGLTSGSTIALTGTGAAGLSISGAVISGTPTTAGAVNIVETLAGATGSPRTTSAVITVATGGPALANLVQVSNTLISTNASETWWADQSNINPAGTVAMQGFTDNTGLQYLAEINPTSLAILDTRRIESPAFWTADEHNCVPFHYHSTNGSLWVAVVGHSNPVTAGAANNARLLFLYSTTGRIADLQVAYTYALLGSDASHGPNYGFWFERPDGTLLFFTNQDADASWGFIGFPSGDYKQPVEYRRIAKGVPTGGGGEAQLYCLPARVSSTVLTLNFQPHPSNARNIIQGYDLNLTTGDVTKAGDATVVGNAFQTYVTGGALVDFGSTAGTLGTVVYDPGAGRSVRIMDAVGRKLAGATFASTDGSTPQHVHIEAGVAYNLGDPGPALDTPRRYFRGIKIARETYTGFRWYRCYNDGSNHAERLDAPTLGGTITRLAQIDIAGTTTKVQRPFVFDRATDTLAVCYTVGTYTNYTTFSTGMQFFGSAGAAVGTTVYDDQFTETAVTLLTAHTSDSGATYTKDTSVGSGDLTVGTNGRTYNQTNTGGGATASATTGSVRHIRAEMTVKKSSALGNNLGVGLRCAANGTHTGYFLQANNANGSYTISRFLNGTGTTVATVSPGAGVVDGDVAVMDVADGASGSINIQMLINGAIQTLTIGGTTGQTYNDAAATTDGLINLNNIKLRNASQITTQTTGVGHDRVRVLTF